MSNSEPQKEQRSNRAADAAGGGRTVTADGANPEPQGGVEREPSATAPKETMKPQMPAKLAGETVTVNKANPEPQAKLSANRAQARKGGELERGGKLRSWCPSLSNLREIRSAIQRYLIYLYISGIKVTFAHKRRKRAIPRSALLRASYHPKGTDTNAGAKVSIPLGLPLFPLPALGSRSTPPCGSGFAPSAVTVRPASFAGIRSFIASFDSEKKNIKLCFRPIKKLKEKTFSSSLLIINN